MRKITICNGKGGSGKTTATILLGLALVEAGHKTRVLDIDPQNTASRWITDGALPLDSQDASATVLIDTPPRLDNPDLKNPFEIVTSSSLSHPLPRRTCLLLRTRPS
jgi:cellulose biosynthesis protein BcsQ